MNILINPVVRRVRFFCRISFAIVFRQQSGHRNGKIPSITKTRAIAVKNILIMSIGMTSLQLEGAEELLLLLLPALVKYLKNCPCGRKTMRSSFPLKAFLYAVILL